MRAVLLACLLASLACSRSDIVVDYGNVTPVGGSSFVPGGQGGVPGAYQPGSAATWLPSTPIPGAAPRTPRPTLEVIGSPTPDAPRASALDRQATEQYTVQRADTLNQIGARYGVTADQIAQANGLRVTDTLFVGQVLLIPLPEKSALGSDLKLLPDSELVYGPGAVDFNVEGFVQAQGGYLASHTEEVPGALLDGRGADSLRLSGSAIVRLVATRYSLHPRLLLALLEYQSGWVTNPAPPDNSKTYPLRRVEPNREGLYRQLAWAAAQLNQGYYGWRVGWLVSFVFDQGGLRVIAPGLNAGTVGVQNFFAKVMNPEGWTRAVSATGFTITYQALFGNPFRLAVEPLAPPDLTQPRLTLPFEPGKAWAFTGGPHAAWDAGSGWAALDFAPPAGAEGCITSDEWIVASAPGLVVRSEYGAVVVDLDEDGDEGSGWALFYMHVERRDRVAVGTQVKTGDRIGHPSCEGGVSSGTHLHFARKYNGEWIAADGSIPFILDGWVSAGLGQEYDGTLSNGLVTIEACDCRTAGNEISRP